jgi:nucleoside-triphosphatase THEP1
MRVAAIIYTKDESNGIDPMLSQLAARLREEGYALAGTVQHNTLDAANRCASMLLEDLATGRMMDVSNPNRPASGGCRLDSTALEDVAGVVASGLERPVDLVVINRFGKQEILGNGLRAAMEKAVASEIPLLTAVNSTHRADWETFAAGLADALPPDRDAVERWCRLALKVGTPSAA